MKNRKVEDEEVDSMARRITGFPSAEVFRAEADMRKARNAGTANSTVWAQTPFVAGTAHATEEVIEVPGTKTKGGKKAMPTTKPKPPRKGSYA